MQQVRHYSKIPFVCVYICPQKFPDCRLWVSNLIVLLLVCSIVNGFTCNQEVLGGQRQKKNSGPMFNVFIGPVYPGAQGKLPPLPPLLAPLPVIVSVGVISSHDPLGSTIPHHLQQACIVSRDSNLASLLRAIAFQIPHNISTLALPQLLS